MPQEEMKSRIFDPIIKDIICLIKEQVAMAGDEVSAVVMVGGFGQSRYLKSKTRDAIASGIQVVQPENGWAAVVKGAVIHGLSQYAPSSATVEVASRVARRSYGTCLLAKYDMMRHDPREAYVHLRAYVIKLCVGPRLTVTMKILVREGRRNGRRGDAVVHSKGRIIYDFSATRFQADNV
jgi:hypothetical protein